MIFPRIKELRKSRALTQTEAAEIFSISQQALSMIEIGKREPSIELLMKFADYYTVSVDFIIGRD